MPGDRSVARNYQIVDRIAFGCVAYPDIWVHNLKALVESARERSDVWAVVEEGLRGVVGLFSDNHFRAIKEVDAVWVYTSLLEVLDTSMRDEFLKKALAVKPLGMLPKCDAAAILARAPIDTRGLLFASLGQERVGRVV